MGVMLVPRSVSKICNCGGPPGPASKSSANGCSLMNSSTPHRHTPFYPRILVGLKAVTEVSGSLTSRILPVLQSHTTISHASGGVPTRIASLEFVIDTELTTSTWVTRIRG